MSSHTSLAQVLSLVINISIVIHERTLFDSLLPFYFHLFFPVFSLYSELDNPIVMESLCYSANKESEDAYDVSTSLTGSSGCSGCSGCSVVWLLGCLVVWLSLALDQPRTTPGPEHPLAPDPCPRPLPGTPLPWTPATHFPALGTLALDTPTRDPPIQNFAFFFFRSRPFFSPISEVFR